MPVEVLGLDDVPLAGDELRVAPDEKIARTVAEARAHRRRRREPRAPDDASPAAPASRTSSRWCSAARSPRSTSSLKADVQGSLEALTDALRKLDQEHDEVRLSFVHRGVGGITESDVNLAVGVERDRHRLQRASRPQGARARRAPRSVEMRLYEVIYQVLEDVQTRALGMLKPEFEEVVTGEAEVREVFSRAARRQGRRLLRAQRRRSPVARRSGSCARASSSGTARSRRCKRFKDDVREVQSGFECGIGLENYQDLKPGDVIETYELREIART